jgi:hypothetical protein
MLYRLMAVALMIATTATSATAKNRPQLATTQLTAEQAADRQVWMDEHARWNAEHLAAARRLEAVVAALKQHNTGFDLHGVELRAHGQDSNASETLLQAHPRLRAAHEQARNVHDDLMDAVDTLTRVLRKNLGKNQSFPTTDEQP